MGAAMARLRKDVKILLVGRSGGGTRKVIESLQLGEFVPASGRSSCASTATRKGLRGSTSVTVYNGTDGDLWTPSSSDGDAERFNAVILVVDTSDRAGLQGLRDSMHKLLDDSSLEGLPLLILANRSGAGEAVSVPELASALDLKSVWNRRWNIQAFHSESQEWLYDGFDWLFSQERCQTQAPITRRHTSALAPMLDTVSRARMLRHFRSSDFKSVDSCSSGSTTASTVCSQNSDARGEVEGSQATLRDPPSPLGASGPPLRRSMTGP